MQHADMPLDSLAMKEHPMEVLGYAIRHGHREIRDQAAPLSLDESFDLAKESLSTEGLLAWVRAQVLSTEPNFWTGQS